LTNMSEWSVQEQRALEDALRNTRDMPATERWNKIAEQVGRRKPECIARYQAVRESLLQKSDAGVENQRVADHESGETASRRNHPEEESSPQQTVTSTEISSNRPEEEKKLHLSTPKSPDVPKGLQAVQPDMPPIQAGAGPEGRKSVPVKAQTTPSNGAPSVPFAASRTGGRGQHITAKSKAESSAETSESNGASSIPLATSRPRGRGQHIPSERADNPRGRGRGSKAARGSLAAASAAPPPPPEPSMDAGTSTDLPSAASAAPTPVTAPAAPAADATCAAPGRRGGKGAGPAGHRRGGPWWRSLEGEVRRRHLGLSVTLSVSLSLSIYLCLYLCLSVCLYLSPSLSLSLPLARAFSLSISISPPPCLISRSVALFHSF
jgi:hypothetical protein